MTYADRLHPLTVFVFYSSILVLTMTATHPAALLPLFVSAILLRGVQIGAKKMLAGTPVALLLLLTVAAAVTLLLSVLGSASAVIETVRQIVAVSGVSTGYLAIMLKVIGICLLTEFAANTCRDAGSSALAANVTLAGKLLVTAAALPLYADILNLVTAMLSR